MHMIALNKCDWRPRIAEDVLRAQLLIGGGIYMQSEKGKPSETPNAPYCAARIQDPLNHASRFPHSVFR
jgi:hypothetical protein